MKLVAGGIQCCVRCGNPLEKTGHGRKTCDRCRAGDPHRHGRRAKGYVLVAIDSEGGINPATGLQETLTFSLGRSDGSRESLVAPAGMSLQTNMLEVFDWLRDQLSVPYKGLKQVPIAFIFNYDAANLLKGFYSDMLLVHKSVARERGLLCDTNHKPDEEPCGKSHRRDQEACRDVLTRGGEGSLVAWDPITKYAFAMTPGRRFYMEYRPNGDLFGENVRIDIHDVGKTFPGTFESQIDKWLSPADYSDGDREIIKWGKKQRVDNFWNTDHEKVARYSEAECVALAKMAEKFLYTLNKATGIIMKPYRLFGAGSVAQEVLKFNHVPTSEKTLVETRIVCGIAIDDIPHLTYYGGKIEAPVIGILTQIGNVKDIVSAYPSKMIHLPCMKEDHGHWEDSPGYQKLPAGTVGYVLAGWSLPDKDITQFPPFMVRDRGGSVYCPKMSDGSLWATLPEYRVATLHPKIKKYLMPEHTVWYVQDCDCVSPLAFLEDLFNLKNHAKKMSKDTSLGDDERSVWAAKSEVYKLIINSCYGKLAQQRPTRGRYTNLHYAAMITGETRAQVNQRVWDIETAGGTVVYVHTDSTTAIGPMVGRSGTKLGDWDDETPKTRLHLMQPGIAIDTGGTGKSATRGVKAADLIRAVTERSEDPEPYRAHPKDWAPVKVSDQRMISLREAFHRGKPEIAGSFFTKPREIGYYSGKRNFREAKPLPNNEYAWILPPCNIVPAEQVATLEDIAGFVAYRAKLREEESETET